MTHRKKCWKKDINVEEKVDIERIRTSKVYSENAEISRIMLVSRQRFRCSLEPVDTSKFKSDRTRDTRALREQHLRMQQTKAVKKESVSQPSGDLAM